MKAEVKKTAIKRPKGTLVIKYKNHTIECVKIAVLAKLCKVKPDTLRRYERAGLLPKPIFRTPSKVAFGKEVLGERLYSRNLAMTLSKAFAKIKKGVPVPHEVKQEIAEAFKKEKEYLTN